MSQLGPYELLEPLGRGGFGTVFRARFTGEGGFSKRVAVKLLHVDSEEIAQRFRDEARLLGLIRHRAIVQVDRLSRIGDRWVVAMEFVEGKNLKQVLAGGPLPVGPALEIIGELAGALFKAYTTRGPDGAPLELLHRDIKPSNVQLTPHGEVKLLDFGIARARFQDREALTRSTNFGSLAYMAPERIDMIEGPQGDVYSLGALLFELLAGEPLGPARAARERQEPFIKARLAWLSARTPLSEELLTLLRGLLAWDPPQRPSADEVELRCLDLVRHHADVYLRSWAGPRIHALDADLAVTQLLASAPPAADKPFVLEPPRAERVPDAPAPQPSSSGPLGDATLWLKARRGDRNLSGALLALACVAALGVLLLMSGDEGLPSASVAAPTLRDGEALTQGLASQANTSPDADAGAPQGKAASETQPDTRRSLPDQDDEGALSPPTPEQDARADARRPTSSIADADTEQALDDLAEPPPVAKQVIIKGDAIHVLAITNGPSPRVYTLPDQRLPPGRYTIRGVFNGDTPSRPSELIVQAHETPRVRCSKTFDVCTQFFF